MDAIGKWLMHPGVTSAIVFLCLFGASILGMQFRRWLPDHHLGEETKDSVRIGMGSVATMAALVLGLLVASTRAAYDTEKNEVMQMASKVIFLDRTLQNYGPEAADARALLRRTTGESVARVWAEQRAGPGAIAPSDAWTMELPRAIQDLQPGTDAQRAFRTQAAQVAGDLGQMRWLLYEQAESSISLPLMVIMVFWLGLTFASVGVFAPGNATVVAAQLTAAFAVSGAVFLILELDQPFAGLIQISNEPMVNALAEIGG